MRCSRQTGGQFRGRGIEFWRGLEGVGATGDPVAARSVALGKVYGRRDTAVAALRSVTLEFPAVEFAAVMGPSGSGKSTLLHCLAALDTPSSGQVFIGDTDISSLNHRERAELRRDRIGFVFQAFNLVPTLTARENITLPQLLAGRLPDRRWLAEVIDHVGLRDRLSHRPAELSGGQQQRVAVARALAGRPEIIFADEPTGNLDTRAGHEVLSLLRAAVDDHSQTIVMVTHDPMAASYADRVVFLGDGSVVDELREPTAERVLERLKSLNGAPDQAPPLPSGRSRGDSAGRRRARVPVTISRRRLAQDAGGRPPRAERRRWFSFAALKGRGEREDGQVRGFFDDPELPAERTSRTSRSASQGRDPRVRPLPSPERPPAVDRARRAPSSSRVQAEARLLAQVRELWDEPDERVLALVRAAVDDQFPDLARPAEDEGSRRARTRPRRGEEPDEVIEHPPTISDDGWLEPLPPIAPVSRSAGARWPDAEDEPADLPRADPSRYEQAASRRAVTEPDRPASAPVERAARGIPYRAARRDETVQWNPRDAVAPPAPAPPRPAAASRDRPPDEDPVGAAPRPAAAPRDRRPDGDPVGASGPPPVTGREWRAGDDDVRPGSRAPVRGDEPPARLLRQTRPSARDQATVRFVQRRGAAGDAVASPAPRADAEPRTGSSADDRRERPAARARPEAAEERSLPGAADDRGERGDAPPRRSWSANADAGQRSAAASAERPAPSQERPRAGSAARVAGPAPAPAQRPAARPAAAATDADADAEADAVTTGRRYDRVPRAADEPEVGGLTEPARPERPQRDRAPAPVSQTPAGSPNERPSGSSPAGREVRAYPARDAAERLLAQVRARSSEAAAAAASPPRAARGDDTTPPSPAAPGGPTSAPPATPTHGPSAANAAAPPPDRGAPSRPTRATPASPPPSDSAPARPATAIGSPPARPAAASDAAPARSRAENGVAPVAARPPAAANGARPTRSRAENGVAVGEDDGFLPAVRGGDAPPADTDTGDNRGLRADREAPASRSSRR